MRFRSCTSCSYCLKRAGSSSCMRSRDMGVLRMLRQNVASTEVYRSEYTLCILGL
ncbi:hypothetical protein COCSUDRAFT_34386 [Coccomyxa subellipsoidea C-169]|uniref:Uncharacterized protein n=1 Tax=Coccomyxa subellipsoidea (strain C-169) TaxID=574566 RepID=I0YLD7_COCSC|nr:hypothetical protein COCSUDRAFT_34386 [Coccomyxa subellipsoidea C-169]EIE19206.1 hypothetical protein COCSUDRAFT_34386 [Coccomyxa subellipsoidea C-169]|eukprot:XP_005643750.1 hypothetical protein COCSUDRAFT_34386 [Coccomyxa subellipsoidea C-169]